MLFSLEALQAKAGDCLLLHYGPKAEPRLIVIDGGPTRSVYERLKARLDALRISGGFAAHGEKLPIELLMVSHIDDDHIDGILHLTQELIDADEKPYEILEMWHNSFDDLIGNGAAELSTAAHGAVEAASTGSDFLDQELVEHDTALILASVNQGRRLRDNARKLSLRPELQVAQADEEPREFGDGLTLRLVGPMQAQLEDLHKKWEKTLKKLDAEGKLDRAAGASFADKSAANLSSLVVLAEMDGKSVLLTGDARGDFMMESLREQQLLDRNGRLHVDIFKLPHHGSERNVERSTFHHITADHYVFSGDGHHGNPDPPTFEMLFGGREDAGLLDRPFKLHLTYAPDEMVKYRGKDYPLGELNRILDAARQRGHDFELLHPKDGAESLVIDLGEASA